MMHKSAAKAGISIETGPSSVRVMAPPGGASSNIFGTEPAYTRQGGDCAPKEAAPSRDTKNRLFGDDSPAPAAAASAEPAPQERAPPAGVNTHAGKRNHGAYNPITGEDYPDQIANYTRPVAEKVTKEQPATRVRQPPGGRSSGPLW